MKNKTFKDAENEAAEIFAFKLNKLMCEKNCAPENLSQQCGISAKRIKIWLNGKTCPRVKNVVKIMGALKCSFEYFLRMEACE